MGYTLTDTVITALLSFFLSRCPILPLMVNTPIHHPASVNVPLLFPLCYWNYDLTVNAYKTFKTYQITVIWYVSRHKSGRSPLCVNSISFDLVGLSPLLCISSLLLCSSAPSGQMGSLIFVGVVALSFPRDLVSYPFLFLKSSGHPCLVPVSIFRSDIFRLSHWHPYQAVL